ncbi:retropepsin-like aspartic protease [Aestuariibaculum lutulentum]|uniref:Retroviral-like aspartic protease family protein n=1 Tax=Aestuariibaculum lutulentum TaxID=2920935 RepID=A0ABS9RK79_9FLAO|nr:retropepsin-like aspartic protease [Aestuariibaculum lutulentum]MCH4553348.1 retroviral-like aspartic protease family protein [Aestuariibaculum lutulentum]
MKFILSILSLFLFVNIHSQNTNLNKGKSSKQYFESIPIEIVKNKIILPVDIQGKTYRFILDTGAPNVISNELKEILNTSKTKTISITDANGKQNQLELILLDKLKIGTVEFTKTPTLIYDLNADPVFKCFKVDGFIGSNLLRHSILQINMKSKKILITDDSKNLELNKSEALEIQFIDNQSSPYIWINLEGKQKARERILVDTGMSEFYNIALENFKLLNTKEIFKIKGKSTGASGVGLFGTQPINEQYKVLTPILKLNHVIFENVPAQTSNDNNSKIGTKLLQKGITTIDYKNKKFYFESDTNTIKVNRPELGFSFSVKDENVIIGYIWNESLKSKLHYGDQLLEINTTPVNLCDIVTSEKISDDLNPIKMKIQPVKGDIFEITVNKE